MLKASRGSISQCTRTLVQMGMVRWSGRPGAARLFRCNMEEMRDFYAHWERELPTIFERWEKEKG